LNDEGEKKVTGKRIRRLINWALPLLGMGLMLFYDLCDTACSYLQGSFLGVDLKLVGILFMTALLAMNLLEKSRLPVPAERLRNLMLAGALGGEVILVHFQIVHETYCAFCLAFGLCLLLLFIANFRRQDRYPALLAFLAGIASFSLFFAGSVVPLYR
jgi:uncharacterized membrane protein